MITSRQFCAGGVRGMDACRGDSGGPALNFQFGVWYVEGIVSYGKRCGMKDWPGVYTKVVHYLNWIERKLAGNL